MRGAGDMKSIDELYNECKSIQQDIKRMLLDSFRYDHSLKQQLNVVATVHELRNDLAIKQREIRERKSI
ncbi:MAG: hypothetical protein JWR54_945 [Mucilaginibacter sp.]|nr:hypothetical protein [Mucilaginibacter sp.]